MILQKTLFLTKNSEDDLSLYCRVLAEIVRQGRVFAEGAFRPFLMTSHALADKVMPSQI
jgi:hypothetical protein